MKVIYLACGRSRLPFDCITYNDIHTKADLNCDMLEVDLSSFDVLIATPPCNYYSRCNYRREFSSYSQQTKHLLPTIIDKFISTGKPFIVENVRNFPLFNDLGLFDKSCFVYFHGRHTYWTNILLNLEGISQVYDFKTIPGYGCKRLHSYVQGGENVDKVLIYFLERVLFKELNIE